MPAKAPPADTPAPKRLSVKKKINEYTYDLDGPVADAIAKLEELLAKHPTATLSYEDIAGNYEDERYGLAVYIERPETDDEMAFRFACEKADKTRLEEAKRRQYEALKAEFEGKGA
jgi:hypothetical protein